MDSTPWLHLAAVAGCPTPMITAFIHLASAMNRIDYIAEGLTLECMGLGGMTADDIAVALAGGQRA